MINDIIFIIWFFLPAGFANMAPIFAAKIPALAKYDAPIDGRRHIGSKRILGDHKTWRGLITGMVTGLIVFLILQLIAKTWTPFCETLGDTYRSLPFYFGALMGFGALAGDSVKSFFKRQMGIKSGKSWLPFDQIDYIIGAILVSLPFIALTAQQCLLAIVLWFLLHIITSYIGYLWKFKDEPI